MSDETKSPAPAVDALTGDYAPPVRLRTWALIVKGFVTDLVRNAEAYHPFGDAAEGNRVMDVSGVPCALGYVADSRGNVAPPPPDGQPLLGHEPAYHDRSNPAAPPPPVLAGSFLGTEPLPIAKAGADQAQGDQDNYATGTDLDHTDGEAVDIQKASHPQAGLVQESPVKSETDPA